MGVGGRGISITLEQFWGVTLSRWENCPPTPCMYHPPSNLLICGYVYFYCTCIMIMHHQDLLYRRTRSLANAENANKKLETAKAKNKGVQEVRGYRGREIGKWQVDCATCCCVFSQAEANQQTASAKFEKFSEIGKQGHTSTLLLNANILCF